MVGADGATNGAPGKAVTPDADGSAPDTAAGGGNAAPMSPHRSAEAPRPQGGRPRRVLVVRKRPANAAGGDASALVLGAAFAVHRFHDERVVLAEVDEVLRTRLVQRQLLQVGQEGLDAAGVDAPEEGHRRLPGRALRRI